MRVLGNLGSAILATPLLLVLLPPFMLLLEVLIPLQLISYQDRISIEIKHILEQFDLYAIVSIPINLRSFKFMKFRKLNS